MEQEEKFKIRVTDEGLSIVDRKGIRLDFTPVEALMLLDILKNEESRLREKSEANSPLPFRIT